MKISHETPLNLLEISRFFNDYDYALDIHFNDHNYFNFFKKSLELNREVILDNSLYERRITGIEFNENKYVQYIKTLKPTYYIIPDAYGGYEENRKLFTDWMKKFNLDLLGFRKIAVVHGRDYDDFVQCYQFFDHLLTSNDMIAFSGGDSIIRHQVIKKMFVEGIINTERKHHLLGLVYPQEYKEYKYLKFITSIDTSLPVTCTYENKKIDEITEKPKFTITQNFYNNKVDLSLLYYNTETFKKEINGTSS